MAKNLPKYVTEFADRHGKYRMRFRRKGQKAHYFKARFGTDAFWNEYNACLQGLAAPPIAPGQERIKPGTIDDLISRYYRTPKWAAQKDSTRKTYRSIIERFRAAHGHRSVADATVEDLDRILGRMKETPSAANNLRKVMRKLFAYSVKIGMRADNPALLTDAYKIDGDGFHTWTEAEIAQYQARHPIGTKARLALELMLWTGQRGRSDVARFGRQNIEDGRIRVRQTKTGTHQLIKIAPQLAEAIEACPSGHLTFLVTEFGKPFTPGGFGNWFRDRCDEAKLPQCSAHGLRKAISRRLADLGSSHSEGKAVTGHKTDKEFTRYAAAADQVRLADSVLDRLSTEHLANQSEKVAIDPAKPLKKGV